MPARPLLVALLLCLAQPAGAQDRTFGGYDCTEDCSGHAAGYRWAEKHAVNDKGDCRGKSSSFEEGCEAYVDDPLRGADEDDDGQSVE